MIRFSVVTIFPEMFDSVLATSLLGRARADGTLTVDFVNPREFTTDRHHTVDDAPYGGGPGMVMKVEPLVRAMESLHGGDARPPHRILLSPAGTPLTQKRVRELARLPHIALLCGRYEGIDERVSELCIDEQISIGDFVMTGGEIPTMALIDAVARHVPGVLGEASSVEEESFSESLLEYPQYTRPADFRGLRVPDVLLSGHHARIASWRRARALERTASRRPDLLAGHAFTDDDRAVWRQLQPAALAPKSYVGLVHYPVNDRNRATVTSAVTNLDIHDIARSCATYGLAGYFAITPVSAQRDKVERIVSVWRHGIAQSGADNRADALECVEVAASIKDVTAELAQRHGTRPLVIGTSARADSLVPRVGFDDLHDLSRASETAPLLLLFGTGWGLADPAITACQAVLEPISGIPAFNHLSVRSAAAIVLDRLFGVHGRART